MKITHTVIQFLTFPLTYTRVSFSKTKFFPLKPPSQELSDFTKYTVKKI